MHQKHVFQARKQRPRGLSGLAPDPRGSTGTWTPWLAPQSTWLIFSRLVLSTEWKKPDHRAFGMIFHFCKAQSTSKTKQCVTGNDEHKIQSQAGAPIGRVRVYLYVGSLFFYSLKHSYTFLLALILHILFRSHLRGKKTEVKTTTHTKSKEKRSPACPLIQPGKCIYKCPSWRPGWGKSVHVVQGSGSSTSACIRTPGGLVKAQRWSPHQEFQSQ